MSILDGMTPTEETNQIVNALAELIQQVDEDCPQEYRTRHLKDSMEDGAELVNAYREKYGS